MPTETPAPPPPPVDPPNVAAAGKNSHFLIYGCGALLALLLLIVATVAITIWWIQRPIKPVVLSAREKAVVDQKVRRLEGVNPTNSATGAVSGANTTRRDQPISGSGTVNTAEDDTKNLRIYLPGSKTLNLTEREINGLLNANTDLGKSVRLEFAQDAVNAYLAVRIPDDFPVGGGKMFRARGRFRVSLGNGGKPYAILEDVTIFGVSLPKAWLGGIKGENLINDAVTGKSQSALLRGIKSLRVEPGKLVLELED
jgi:hypothetical protein